MGLQTAGWPQPTIHAWAVKLRKRMSLISPRYLVLTHHSRKVHQEPPASSQLRIGKNPPLEPLGKRTLLTELQERQSMGAIPSFLAVSSSFNSLFRVLCTFRSRYLFAIDISAVFSLGWYLSPILGLHSQANRLSEIVTRVATQHSGPWTGLSPSLALLSNRFWPSADGREHHSQNYNSGRLSPSRF